MIQEAVRSILISYPSVTDLVGTRVYQDRMPQNAALPAIVFSTTNTVYNDTKSGASTLDEVYVQFDILQERGQSVSVETIAEEVRRILDRYPHGEVPGTSTELSGVSIVEGGGQYYEDVNIEHRLEEYKFRLCRIIIESFDIMADFSTSETLTGVKFLGSNVYQITIPISEADIVAGTKDITGFTGDYIDWVVKINYVVHDLNVPAASDTNFASTGTGIPSVFKDSDDGNQWKLWLIGLSGLTRDEKSGVAAYCTIYYTKP